MALGWGEREPERGLQLLLCFHRRWMWPLLQDAASTFRERLREEGMREEGEKRGERETEK